ncbi:MAG: hypothetical protein R3E01_04820 [Pirellulaceae bacterium]|nr:hypothetical protein [Planctomycetales bacterium]
MRRVAKALAVILLLFAVYFWFIRRDRILNLFPAEGLLLMLVVMLSNESQKRWLATRWLALLAIEFASIMCIGLFLPHMADGDNLFVLMDYLFHASVVAVYVQILVLSVYLFVGGCNRFDDT